MSLAVEFVAAAADVRAAFVVVVVAAVAACIKTFVAVVLGPSSLFPSLLSFSQNLSLPFLSDTQWFLIHLPFFLGLLHHSSSPSKVKSKSHSGFHSIYQIKHQTTHIVMFITHDKLCK